MSIRGARFAQVRTPEAFRSWAAEEPQAAATWLGKVARTVGAPDQFSAAEPAKLGDAFDQLAAKSIGELQTARAGTIGWSTEQPRGDAPAITGTLRLDDNGEPVLDTPAGTLSMVNANFFDLEGGDWTKNHFLGGHDVAAFAGQTVTVKGWPDASWAPGSPAKLVVEEFAPGATPDFVSGRVLVQGDDVLVRVRPGKDVKVLDPTLAAQLKAFPQLGVILPGATEQKGDAWTFAGNPDGYYVLAGFSGSGAPANGRTPVAFFGAHGKGIPGSMDSAAFNAGSARRDCHYIFGQFVNGQLEAKGYTPYAGPWVGSGAKPEPSTRFAEWATPVDEAPPASFAPPPPPVETPLSSMLALTADQRWAGYQVSGVRMYSGFGQSYPENAERLGKPLEEEHADGNGGALQMFEKGLMHWSPATGIRIGTVKPQAELVKLTQDQRWAGYDAGVFQVVRGFGMVYPEYADRLGMPLEPEHGDGADGSVQKFARGVMTWNPRDGVKALPNA